MKLTDLRTKDTALKASYVAKHIASENEQSPLLYGLPIQHPYIWQCNITSHEVEQSTTENLFSFQVWAAWAKINSHVPTNTQEVLDQSI